MYSVHGAAIAQESGSINLIRFDNTTARVDRYDINRFGLPILKGKTILKSFIKEKDGPATNYLPIMDVEISTVAMSQDSRHLAVHYHFGSDKSPFVSIIRIYSLKSGAVLRVLKPASSHGEIISMKWLQPGILEYTDRLNGMVGPNKSETETTDIKCLFLTDTKEVLEIQNESAVSAKSDGVEIQKRDQPFRKVLNKLRIQQPNSFDAGGVGSDPYAWLQDGIIGCISNDGNLAVCRVSNTNNWPRFCLVDQSKKLGEFTLRKGEITTKIKISRSSVYCIVHKDAASWAEIRPINNLSKVSRLPGNYIID